MRCHWTHEHAPHEWTPLVPDPEEPRVLHLLGQAVRCPGLTLCSAEGCTNPATETLQLRGQVGHVHDCPSDAAMLREFCDVVSSAPFTPEGCPVVGCTPGDAAIAHEAPPMLDQPW